MIPQHPEAERMALAAMLASRPDRERAVGMLTGDDFYDPAHRAVFDAIADLHAQGQAVDALAVALRSEVPPADVRALHRDLPAAPLTAFRTCAELGTRRRIIREAGNLAHAAEEGDLGAVLAQAAALVDRIDAPGGTETTYDVADLARMEFTEDWIVPNLLERGDRLILTGSEGLGKSTALRSWGLMLAAGLHPFTQARIRPVRVLLVDLENPISLLAEEFARMLPNTAAYTDTMRVWHKVDGIDMRDGRDAQRLSALVEAHKAELVIIGPLYKAYRTKGRESKNDETVAEECAYAFDRLRARHGCALWIEAHSPHGEGGDRANLRPYGASLWLRWPEFGFGLKGEKVNPGERRTAEVVAWRGVRRRGRDWPRRLVEGGSFPWLPAE